MARCAQPRVRVLVKRVAGEDFAGKYLHPGQQEEDVEGQQGAMLSLHLDLTSQLTKNKRRQHGNLSLCIVIFVSMVLSAQ